MPAPATGAAHRLRLAAAMREGLGTVKPQPGRRLDAGRRLMPAPATGAAHRLRLAAAMREGLGTVKPQPGRRVAAQLIAAIRGTRTPSTRGADVFDAAANAAAHLACQYLRAGDHDGARKYADAEQLLTDWASRARTRRLARISRDLATAGAALTGWAA
ncbi:hypothetical protein [Litorihabitans aurantiacus]|uniref:Uncharacterized protein n=1 Tax=Litorihabitans aurantiacus TaxID=1930061 RepID=A0AA37XE97_9MICO|nr:hypothetical protein [Litorihabitans aurantiacus]GMA31573.1 hypothetical protein GCM10025875_15650 [Litorihabitans aurantiacus]